MSFFCNRSQQNKTTAGSPQAVNSLPPDEKVQVAARKMAKQVLLDPEKSREVWDQIFEQESPSPDHLTEVVAYLHDRKHYSVAVEGLLSAIRHDQASPWIYDVLALEMKLAGHPKKDIARVLSSRVDFATSDVPQMLIAVAMLSRFEAWDEANAMVREASELNPQIVEIWMLGRSVADKSGDAEARVRARCGILNYVWSDGFELHHEEARRVLTEIASQHDREGRSDSGERVRSSMEDAATIDLQIILKWVGSADLDLIVSEPGGAKCSYRQKLTTNGGRLIKEDGPGAAAGREAGRKCTEHYICHSAPDGRYDIAVRFVLGKAVGGTAVVEVIQHGGTSAETRTTTVVMLGKEDASLSTELGGGRGTAR